jgi:hypothetical protein
MPSTLLPARSLSTLAALFSPRSARSRSRTSDPRLRLSYNDIHNAIARTAPRIMSEFSPDLFIAIGGGGFIPARILRTFCKVTTEGKKRNIPIQAVGLTLYESLGGVSLFPKWEGWGGCRGCGEAVGE